MWDFVRLVDGLKPRGVLVENVVGLRDMEFVSEITKVFADIGYAITPFILRRPEPAASAASSHPSSSLWSAR